MGRQLLTYFTLVTILSLHNLAVHGQGQNTPSDTSEYIFADPVVPPKFPGGEKALIQFIDENLPKQQGYPVTGTVFVSFTVGIDGKVSNVEVRKGIDPYLDKDAVDIVKRLPKWEAATLEGKPIPFDFVVPVKFHL